AVLWYLIQPVTPAAVLRVPPSKPGEPSSTAWVPTMFSRSIGRYERSIAAWSTKHPALISTVWIQTAGHTQPNRPQASISVFESRGRRRGTGVQPDTRTTQLYWTVTGRDLHPLDFIKKFHRLILGSSSSKLFPAR